jgi:uncharacterized paraquat-inducible protein A
VSPENIAGEASGLYDYSTYTGSLLARRVSEDFGVVSSLTLRASIVALRYSVLEKAMALRPRKKATKKNKFRRCPKCQKQVRIHQKRCRTCHQVLHKL